MSTEAEKIFESAFGIAKAFFDHPAIKAYYERLARENREKLEAEQRVSEAKRLADEKKRSRAFWYDHGDIFGCGPHGDECHRFGIMAGCAPHCPVFVRGECKNGYDGSVA